MYIFWFIHYENANYWSEIEEVSVQGLQVFPKTQPETVVLQMRTVNVYCQFGDVVNKHAPSKTKYLLGNNI